MNEHAQALGRMGKGRKKTITEAERLRRQKHMNNVNLNRRKKVESPPTELKA